MTSMIAMIVASLTMMQGAALPTRAIEKSAQSYIEHKQEVVVRTPEEWAALWKKHAPNRPAPDVDFTREMVVGVFLGTRTSAGYSVDITGVDQEAGGIVVRYQENAPGRGMVTAQIITSPYSLVAVPKTEGAVRFEQTAP